MDYTVSLTYKDLELIIKALARERMYMGDLINSKIATKKDFGGDFDYIQELSEYLEERTEYVS
jgi:hypothetical protein